MSGADPLSTTATGEAGTNDDGPLVPGAIRAAAGEHELLAGRDTITLVATNTGDRPIQVGSHFEFSQVNSAMEFDRDAAAGHRLAIAAGTAVRFEPGASREVSLVALAGAGVVPGLQIRDETGTSDSGGES